MTSLRASVIAALLGLAANPVTAGGPDYVRNWADLLEACTRYAETGLREVFLGWDVAWPGGGVCNGDPSCETPVMTFIGNGCFGVTAKAETVCAQGIGAVTVVVAGKVVGDRPQRASCSSAIALRHSADQARLGTAPWIRRAVAQGRLTKAANAWLGCTWDGRTFRLVVDLDARMPSFHVGFPVDEPGFPCTERTS